MTKNNNEKQTHLDVHKCSKPLQTFVDKHSKKEKWVKRSFNYKKELLAN
jgi:hypothetical protein